MTLYSEIKKKFPEFSHQLREYKNESGDETYNYALLESYIMPEVMRRLSESTADDLVFKFLAFSAEKLESSDPNISNLFGIGVVETLYLFLLRNCKDYQRDKILKTLPKNITDHLYKIDSKFSKLF